jgi:hypothetical protein|eukprot:Tamp_20121.p1 GENE.Tamp_20121~~Tamp_20121.p1  ORF type:complete len:262 (+),score=37.60 Tamp_20121:28-813(+)
MGVNTKRAAFTVGIACVAMVLLTGLFVRILERPPRGTRKVILIRHGEKEGHKGDWGNGLSAAGKWRAQCLAKRYKHLGVTNLFAFNNKHTTRPVDTLTPLANQLHIPIDTEFHRGAMKEMAAYILALPKRNLSVVCWEHDRLHTIAHDLGVPFEEIPQDLMQFKSFSWDKMWSIYFDIEAKSGSVSIVEEQQECTYGVHYHGEFFYWLLVLGGLILLVLGFVVWYVSAACCGHQNEPIRLPRDDAAADAPLLDDAARTQHA